MFQQKTLNKFKAVNALLASGKTVEDACQRNQLSISSYYKVKNSSHKPEAVTTTSTKTYKLSEKNITIDFGYLSVSCKASDAPRVIEKLA